jgi:hypothetical protein
MALVYAIWGHAIDSDRLGLSYIELGEGGYLLLLSAAVQFAGGIVSRLTRIT